MCGGVESAMCVSVKLARGMDQSVIKLGILFLLY